MLVAYSKKSYWRNQHTVQARRNGDFIDVFFEQDGRVKWIGIERKSLEKALNEGSAKVLISFDNAANIETLTLDFQESLEKFKK